MFNITIDAQPTTQQLLAFVKQVEQDILADLTDFWQNHATVLVVQEITRVFASEGYGRWPQLSPAYARQKARTHPGKTILRRDDNYFQAATQSDHAGNIHEYEKDSMIWGIDLGWFTSNFGYPYPLGHEQGRGNLPARPVFGMVQGSEDLENKLIASFVGYVQNRVSMEAKKVFT